MDKQRQIKKSKLFRPDRIDPYQSSVHSKGGSLCAECGATYHAGRWSWQTLASGVTAEQTTCPACRRIADKAPAGEVQLTGPYVRAHHDEILSLVQHTEEAEKKTHALERLLQISEQADGLLITTTGLHLANRIGHALDAAHKGHAVYQYTDNRSHLQVHWSRD